MNIIKPYIEFLWMTENALQTIEKAGRTCYKSEDKITEGSALTFAKMLIERKHMAMIEHASMSYRVVCDRGVTHEIVRHRLFSYAQESTRYVNYQKKGMQVIKPVFWNKSDDITKESICYDVWVQHMEEAEMAYNSLIQEGAKPEEARNVLPNSLKTEIVITGNLREWRHFFELRTGGKAHPQMQEVANLLLVDAQSRIPIIFEKTW